MTRYSIRRLFLPTRSAVLVELGEAHQSHADIFSAQARRHAWTLKLISREPPFPSPLLAAFSMRGIACWMASTSTVYLFSNPADLERLSDERSFFNNDEEIFAFDLGHFLERQRRIHFTLRTPQHSIVAGQKTLIMGVLNLTPDSFSDGGRYFEKHAAIEHALRMAEAGADIIDIGGESTRPAGTYGGGAMPVSESEELQRVIPVIEEVAKSTTAVISIDTYKSPVAKAAIQAGAGMVNDISGFQFDPQMAEIVAQENVPVIVMHTKGSPREMQQNPSYGNLMEELFQYFEERLEIAGQAGISADQIIVDPGLGFGKRLQDNYVILRRLEEFHGLGCPILVGPSRKSFIGKVLEVPVDQRLEGTAAAVALAIAHGAHLVRVHDVKEIHRVVKIADMIIGRTADSEILNWG